MVVKIQVKGINVHRARLKRLRNLKNESIKQLYAAGEIIRKHAADSIIAGAVSGPQHLPSAPGEPPNADTHNLDRSIDVRVNTSQKSVRVTARAHYAAAQEFGTARILPRPFMRPALQANKNRIVYGQVQAMRATVKVFKSQGAFDASRQRFDDGQG